MEVRASEAVEVFVAAGVYTARDWPLERIQGKIDHPAGMERYVGGPEDATAHLLHAIIETQSRDEKVTVIEDRSASEDMAKKAQAPAKKTPPKKPKKGKPPKPRPDRTVPYAERRKNWKKRPVEITRKGPGVMLVVLEELITAGKTGAPMTKEDLLRVLIVRFPDRSQAGMATNLNNLIPGRLREHYSIEVQKVRTAGRRMGYWIDPKTAVLKTQ